YFKNCRPFLRRQIEIVKPLVVVCLGRLAYRAVLATFGLTPDNGPHQRAVEGNPVQLFEGGPLAVAMYDCSPLGLIKRKREKQRKAWQRLKAVLSVPTAAATLPVTPAPPGNVIPGHHLVTGYRVIRDTAVTADVKGRHDNQCQVCGQGLELPN